MQTPSLLSLDPAALRPLRGRRYADAKNTIMMAILNETEWFANFREQLKAYRKHGGNPPQYPTNQVEAVEKCVDDLLRLTLDTEYKRV